MRFSLIIPAYNEARYIEKTLCSVEAARDSYTRPSRIEIIVVDNRSTDGTAGIARSRGVTVVTETERRIAAARNRGAKAASGDAIGFLDADSLVTPNIFTVIGDVMASDRFIGGGTDIKLERESPGIFLTLCITKYPAMWLLGVSGGLIFTSRETFDELGGFDQSLYCGEDMKFVFQLKKHGRKIGKTFKVVRNASVTTSARAFDAHGDWYYFRNLPGMLTRRDAFRDRQFAARFWYDVRP